MNVAKFGEAYIEFDRLFLYKRVITSVDNNNTKTIEKLSISFFIMFIY